MEKVLFEGNGITSLGSVDGEEDLKPKGEVKIFQRGKLNFDSFFFSVLVVGTRFGCEEVDELLLPYCYFYELFSEEEMRADPRFGFKTINIGKLFEERKLEYPWLAEECKNAEDWAKTLEDICYDKDQGWGFWCINNWKESKCTGYLIGWYEHHWSDFFLLKEGAESNLNIPIVFTERPTDERATYQARKCDIDWEAMRRITREKAEQDWEAAIKNEPLNFYTKESYFERYEKNTWVNTVVLMDGEWHENKRDFWTDPAEYKRTIIEWNKKFQKLFDKIPDDAVLTLVECYI